MTRVLPCSCSHDFQDRTYGLGRRVHNRTKAAAWRCTVCTRTRSDDGTMVAGKKSASTSPQIVTTEKGGQPTAQRKNRKTR